MTYFDGIKIGDRPWDFERGYGTVVDIEHFNDGYNKEKVHNIIVVRFDEYGTKYRYFYDGTRFDSPFKRQTLFWSKPEIKIPEKPKVKLSVDEIETKKEMK